MAPQTGEIWFGILLSAANYAPGQQ